MAAGWLSALAPAGIFAWLLSQTAKVGGGEALAWSAQWVPQLGVTLGFTLDGPGMLLSMLVSGIGMLILIYGGGYFKGSPQAVPFFAFVQLFMLAMLGVASSDNLLLLFVFWELTSLASYLLIGLNHSLADARRSALRALLVTGAGGLALLMAVLLLGAAGGSFNLSELLTKGEVIRASGFYPAIFILVALAAFTKSAQFPFHFWLPEAMAAPTPVSAYLHSATMVKAGIFLLAKLNPILGGTALWHDTLTLFGVTTMLLGSFWALGQTDLKRLLAYSTMSALGTLVMLLGMGTNLAVTAAMVFLVVHALYKAPLFMIAGVVDKATGTRDIDLLQGLGRQMPLLAVMAAFAAFSMSGVPPFIGFIGKELLYEAGMQASRYSLLITCMGFAANAVNVAVAMKVGISPFLSRGEAPVVNPKARKFSLLIGPSLLTLAGAAFGLFPALLGENFISAAVRDIVLHPVGVDLKLWHGFTLLLGISVATILVGVILNFYRIQVRAAVRYLLEKPPMTAAQLFDASLARVIHFAGAATRLVQNGSLRNYIAMLLGTLVILIGAALMTTKWGIGFNTANLHATPIGIALLMVASSVVAITSRSAVMVVLAMGGVGFGVALLFGVFGAPDLALTQVLVETLTLALFALILRFLPEIRRLSSPSRRRSDLLIAGAAGIAVTLALLAAANSPIPQEERISHAMATRSFPEAHGKNVVNVILVDFRALDTMGEATVLAIAALGVGGLLLGSGRGERRFLQAVATPPMQVAAKYLTPLLIFMSAILLFRGHNEPGGGFIGGLVAGAGIILRRLACIGGKIPSERGPFVLIASGLLVIVVSTLPAVFPRAVFMQGVWGGSLWLPIVGQTKFGTPFLFDIGVYSVVIGVTYLILTRLLRSESANPSEASF